VGGSFSLYLRVDSGTLKTTMFRTMFILIFLTRAALADTWTVDDDGKADFDNIQAAVDAASDGDEIVVMARELNGGVLPKATFPQESTDEE
jgi:hypothetical protein